MKHLRFYRTIEEFAVMFPPFHSPLLWLDPEVPLPYDIDSRSLGAQLPWPFNREKDY
jgi:hypothetical protein